MKLKLKRLHPQAKLPMKGSKMAACLDLYSVADVELKPLQTKLIPTGWAMQPEEAQWELQIRGRSSLSLKGILCHPGTVDADYTGEVGVILTNLNPNLEFHVHAGDRVAQMSLKRVAEPELLEVETLMKRGREGGFGSTGR